MQKNISSIILIFLITIFIFYPLQGMEKEGLCSICQINMTNEKLTITLSCNHLFHSECLVDWIAIKKMKTDCPVCRREIFASSIRVITDAPEHKDIVTSGSNYLKSYVTVLKKPSTYKPLLIPAISLSSLWVLLNRDVSRDGLILKGVMATGIYCLLTPYGISRRFRWFSAERAKRIIGHALIWGSHVSYQDGLPIGHKDGLGLSIFCGLIVSIGLESMVAIGERLIANTINNSKDIDILGSVYVGGAAFGVLSKKFFKPRST